MRLFGKKPENQQPQIDLSQLNSRFVVPGATQAPESTSQGPQQGRPPQGPQHQYGQPIQPYNGDLPAMPITTDSESLRYQDTTALMREIAVLSERLRKQDVTMNLIKSSLDTVEQFKARLENEVKAGKGAALSMAQQLTSEEILRKRQAGEAVDDWSVPQSINFVSQHVAEKLVAARRDQELRQQAMDEIAQLKRTVAELSSQLEETRHAAYRAPVAATHQPSVHPQPAAPQGSPVETLTAVPLVQRHTEPEAQMSVPPQPVSQPVAPQPVAPQPVAAQPTHKPAPASAPQPAPQPANAEPLSELLQVKLQDLMKRLNDFHKALVAEMGRTGIARVAELRETPAMAEMFKNRALFDTVYDELKKMTVLDYDVVDYGYKQGKGDTFNLSPLGIILYRHLTGQEPLESDRFKQARLYGSIERAHYLKDVVAALEAANYEARILPPQELGQPNMGADIEAKAQNGKVRYYIVEPSGADQDPFYKRLDALFELTKEWYVIAPNGRNLDKDVRPAVFKWVVAHRGGRDAVAGLVVTFGPLEQIKNDVMAPPIKY